MRIYLQVTDENKTFESQNLELILRSNNDQVIDCLFVDEDDAGLDITGGTLYFTVKNYPTDTLAHAVLNKTYAGSTFVDPTNGEAEIILTDTDTASLLGSYFYSIVIKFSDGTVKTAAEGIVNFLREVRETF